MSSGTATALLLALAVVVAASRAAGALARRLGQPAVVGEITVGLLAGPTLLHGAVADVLFPPDVRPLLSALAQVGVALFMFGVGLELDPASVRTRSRVSTSVAVASTALPFGFGVLLALLLASRHAVGDRTGFALFLGAALSVTAFPVLARILDERGWGTSPLGALALAAAALADLLAWSVIAVVVAVVGAPGRPAWAAALVLPFLLVLVFAVRPLLARLDRCGDGRAGGRMLAVGLVGLLLCGAATEAMGLHVVVGAFLFGLVMPRPTGARGPDGGAHGAWTGATRVAVMLLLPVYFVVAGLGVDLTSVGARGVAELAGVLVVAVGGKVGGTLLAARLHRVPRAEAAALAALMNTRGLTELVVLTLGREMGLLDGPLYAVLVLMALLTTAATGPALYWITRRGQGPVTEPVPDGVGTGTPAVPATGQRD